MQLIAIPLAALSKGRLRESAVDFICIFGLVARCWTPARRCICFPAYVMNHVIDCNCMFLAADDGTPYDILCNLVDGNRVLCPLGLVGLFLFHITVYYQVYYWVVQALLRRHAGVRR